MKVICWGLSTIIIASKERLLPFQRMNKEVILHKLIWCVIKRFLGEITTNSVKGTLE